MSNQEHVLGLIDSHPNSTAVLDVAHDVVERGGRATLVVVLSSDDRRHIRDLADAEDIGVPDATALYMDNITETYGAFVGKTATVTVLHAPSLDPRAAIATAADEGVTIVALPSSLAGTRQGRSAIGRTAVPVLVVPARAA